MSETYVTERAGVLYVHGTRVPLESLVWPWRDGHSAEEIREEYPTLTLAQVYGAIAYYLDHQEAVDRMLEEGVAKFDEKRRAAETNEPKRYSELRQRFKDAQARHTAQTPAS